MLREPGRTRSAANGGWKVNGSKNFITHAIACNTLVAVAVTDKEKGNKGISAFIFDKSMEGFRSDKKENKLGMRASETASVVFEDCYVPDENRLGNEGEGFLQAMQVLDGGRISIAALSVGIAQGAYEAAVKYAKERQQFGKPIAEFQAIQFKLADMATQIEAARLIDAAGRSPERRRKEDYEPIRDGETVCVRDSGSGFRRIRTDPWRLRLHERLPGGKILA